MRDTISKIIENEGGSTATNDPNDAGGRTQYGISERAHPAVWSDGKVTLDEATDIYIEQYVEKPHFDRIPDSYLAFQVADCGVMSGPATAVKILQGVLKINADGQLGPATLAAIQSFPPQEIFGSLLPGPLALNLAFQQARVLHYARLTQRIPRNLKFIVGWIRRAFNSD